MVQCWRGDSEPGSGFRWSARPLTCTWSRLGGAYENKPGLRSPGESHATLGVHVLKRILSEAKCFDCETACCGWLRGVAHHILLPVPGTSVSVLTVATFSLVVYPVSSAFLGLDSSRVTRASGHRSGPMGSCSLSSQARAWPLTVDRRYLGADRHWSPKGLTKLQGKGPVEINQALFFRSCVTCAWHCGLSTGSFSVGHPVLQALCSIPGCHPPCARSSPSCDTHTCSWISEAFMSCREEEPLEAYLGDSAGCTGQGRSGRILASGEGTLGANQPFLVLMFSPDMGQGWGNIAHSR
jgi:hypothetical protein